MTEPGLARLVARSLARHGLTDLVEATCVERLAAFASRLLRHGARSNLVGITEPARLIDEVVVDSLQAVRFLKGEGRILDLGSGAGIPAIPIAIARPRWTVVSVEPRAKRVLFQQSTRRALGLANLVVIEGRLGDDGALPSAAAGGFDAAITKAVWDADTWVERGAALVEQEGTVLAFLNGAAPALADASVTFEACAYALADGRTRSVIAARAPS